MAKRTIPLSVRSLKLWLSAAVLLLLLSLEHTSVVIPTGGLDCDDLPNPVDGWTCLGAAYGMAREGDLEGILFLIPTLWIPASLVLACFRRSVMPAALVLSTACLFIEIGAGAWVLRLGFGLDLGYVIWAAATLTQISGFVLQLDAYAAHPGNAGSPADILRTPPASIAQGEA